MRKINQILLFKYATLILGIIFTILVIFGTYETYQEYKHNTLQEVYKFKTIDSQNITHYVYVLDTNNMTYSNESIYINGKIEYTDIKKITFIK